MVTEPFSLAFHGTYFGQCCSVHYTEGEPGQEWSRDNGIVQKYKVQLLSSPSPFTELGPASWVCVRKQMAVGSLEPHQRQPVNEDEWPGERCQKPKFRNQKHSGKRKRQKLN